MSQQWTAPNVMALMQGFQPACVLAAGAELDVFTHLNDKPRRAAELAKRLRVDVRGLTTLLDALAALGLLAKRGLAYKVPADVAQLLTERGGRSLLGMVRLQANSIRRWGQLAQVVATGKPAPRVPSIRGAAGDTESFIRAMDEISLPAADALVSHLKGVKFTHLLDIGGGPATWTIALLRLAPQAVATLFDLPDVLPLARERLERVGMSGRVTLVGGDFDKRPLPKGADLAWLGAIVHMNSRRQNRALLAKTRAALQPGGRLVIRDVLVDRTRTKPPMGALFAINMLVATAGGGTFTFDELREDLLAAGFTKPRLLHAGDAMDSLILALSGIPARHPR